MKCHACSKGTFASQKKSQIYIYKGKSIMLDQPGLWCDTCEEGILNGDDVAKTEKYFEKFKTKVDGL